MVFSGEEAGVLEGALLEFIVWLIECHQTLVKPAMPREYLLLRDHRALTLPRLEIPEIVFNNLLNKDLIHDLQVLPPLKCLAPPGVDPVVGEVAEVADMDFVVKAGLLEVAE